MYTRPIVAYLVYFIYSQTCIKKSPLGQRKWSSQTGDLLKEGKLYEIFYDRKRKRWHFNTSDCQCL